MSRILPCLFVLLYCLQARADLDLRPVHRDESADYTYNQRFSLQHALSGLDFIEGALHSFRKLTEVSAGKISRETMKEIGNTGWGSQNMGFENMPNSIRGALYKQDYVIKKLTYELGKAKVRAGEQTPEDLANAEKNLKQAEQTFQEFWDAFHVFD